MKITNFRMFKAALQMPLSWGRINEIDDTLTFNMSDFEKKMLNYYLDTINEIKYDLILKKNLDNNKVYFGDYTYEGINLKRYVYLSRRDNYTIQIICSTSEYTFNSYSFTF
jgi:hypothetical protein